MERSLTNNKEFPYDLPSCSIRYNRAHARRQTYPGLPATSWFQAIFFLTTRPSCSIPSVQTGRMNLPEMHIDHQVSSRLHVPYLNNPEYIHIYICNNISLSPNQFTLSSLDYLLWSEIFSTILIFQLQLLYTLFRTSSKQQKENIFVGRRQCLIVIIWCFRSHYSVICGIQSNLPGLRRHARVVWPWFVVIILSAGGHASTPFSAKAPTSFGSAAEEWRYCRFCTCTR